RATGRRLGNPAAEQAQGPPTNPVEMGLPDIACAVYRASQRPYRALFESVWGKQAFAIEWPNDVEQVCDQPGPPSASDPMPVHLSELDRGRAAATFDQMAQSIAGYEASDARVLKDLADIHFVHAKTIVLVQDNLSIHSKASLYEAFPAVEARRLIERFEWHYTPKHGSWLNLAESELGVLTSQCLDRRIPNKQILIDEIAAWEHDRNANHTKADWQFTTKNARIKLKHLYPAI